MFFLWHLFLLSWPKVSTVCLELLTEDYGRKIGPLSKSFQKDANKVVSLSLYKHVNVLEHLQRKALSEGGPQDWWLITLVN